MGTRGTEREKYLKSLDGLNEFERLVRNLNSGEFTLRMLEMAYRGHIRDREDLPEGVKNLLVQPEGGGIVKFAKHIGEIIGNVHLAFMRGESKYKPTNKEK